MEQERALRGVGIPLLVVLALLLLAFEDLCNGCRSGFSRRRLLLCKFGFPADFFALKAVVASFKSKPGSCSPRFFIGEFPDAAFGDAKVGGQWDMTRTYEIAATALNAVHKSEITQLHFVVGTRIPE